MVRAPELRGCKSVKESLREREGKLLKREGGNDDRIRVALGY